MAQHPRRQSSSGRLLLRKQIPFYSGNQTLSYTHYT
jgi:hypothetical protein